jgi:hypothetical protein
MTKLKRCPMCDSKAKIVEIGNKFYPVCIGPKLGVCLLKRQPVWEDGFIFKKDAIEIWNKRVEDNKK